LSEKLVVRWALWRKRENVRDVKDAGRSYRRFSVSAEFAIQVCEENVWLVVSFVTQQNPVSKPTSISRSVG
jgi:hypothetical protein